MRTSHILAAAAALAASAGIALAAPGPHINAAVADKGRPAADRDLDDERKPAQMLEFAEVRPGAKVADFIPGGGYFTRIFSKAVGANGKVYAVTNPPPPNATAQPPIMALAADPQYRNVQVVSTGVGAFKLPEPVDVFWTSQNYHDLYLTRLNVNVPNALKAIYDSIRPGGLFIVLDHVANAGAPVSETANTLHRIDPAAVRQQVEAAGFQFVGESRLLRNPQDDHTKGVFDPSIRSRTDQFIYKFRKPR